MSSWLCEQCLRNLSRIFHSGLRYVCNTIHVISIGCWKGYWSRVPATSTAEKLFKGRLFESALNSRCIVGFPWNLLCFIRVQDRIHDTNLIKGLPRYGPSFQKQILQTFSCIPVRLEPGFRLSTNRSVSLVVQVQGVCDNHCLNEEGMLKILHWKGCKRKK